MIRGSPNWAALVLIAGLHVAALAALATLTRTAFAPLEIVPIRMVETPDAPHAPQDQPLELAQTSHPLFIAPVIKPVAVSPFTVAAEEVRRPAPPVTAVAVDAPPAETPAPAVTPPGFDADYLNNPPPRYPEASRRAREQGEVILKVLVSPKGGAEDVQLHSSSGFSRLDNAAMRAVARWRFTPARQAGRTVTAWVLVPLTFSLDQA